MDDRTPIEAAAETQALPRPLGPYTLLRRIGSGGMGTVYEALQPKPERRVALKLIRSDQISEELLRRFAIEIQALGRLRHPGIARIYEGGTATTSEGPCPYFVMELVDGMPIDAYVATQSVGIRECIGLVIGLAEAVHHAHQHDVIHRDLKPANILVDETGQPRILDFGVAHITGAPHGAADETQAGVLLGTLPYMSPEQTAADPDEFDQRSDVYALGVIAYRLLTGRLPYKFVGGVIDALATIREAAPQRLGDIDERLRGDLETVMNKALAKERTRRYQTAQALADDLRRVVRGEPVSVHSVSIGATIRRLTMREDNMRQGGWVGVFGFLLISLFCAVWLVLAAIAWFWWPPILPRDIRHAEFMANSVFWTSYLALSAYLHWRITRGHLPSMWVAFLASIPLAAFTTAVLMGVLPYDHGGAMREPLLRIALYMIFSALAWADVFVTLLALITTYRLRRWDQPVVVRAPARAKPSEV